jgi:UDP-2,3-diacylglucosamine pyrophosphatase LpxH
MIVFISDLHFVDSTAGEHNAPADAFRMFLDEIRWAAERRMEKGHGVQRIRIVFLGDIFDVLRTEQWFSVPVSERPWGSNTKKIEAFANKIFDDITTKNKETFDLLGGNLVKTLGFHVEPERIYIPGNHDRLCNLYPSLRKKVRQNLGIAPSDEVFEHTFQDTDHGVFARHGHEYDKFNYEGGLNYRYSDYMRIPIGDPITTELVAALPWKVMQHPAVKKLDAQERKDLRKNLEEIENVRPFSATLEWLLYRVKSNLSAKEAIEDSVADLVKEFEKLPFVKKWYAHHDKWMDWQDRADRIQAMLYLLKTFRVFASERWLPLLDKVKEWFAKDDLLEAAPAEYTHLDSSIRYVVYGHTHIPLQAALRLVPAVPEPRSHIYLNTGTWRSLYLRCKEGLGFIGWKNLTYVTLWTKEERGLDFPSFETWTGTLKNF